MTQTFIVLFCALSPEAYMHSLVLFAIITKHECRVGAKSTHVSIVDLGCMLEVSVLAAEMLKSDAPLLLAKISR